mmetsp:Transcript_25414/g.100336  ORF Transcript_25414/g.100336 Transcript_25414/m.100336 type:complete len:89 (-) Transcript_25414:1777-2043(-)
MIYQFAVRMMMYGFGDVHSPLPQSIDLMEDLVIQYICNLVQRVRRFSPFIATMSDGRERQQILKQSCISLLTSFRATKSQATGEETAP